MGLPRTIRRGYEGFEVAWWREAIGAERSPSLVFDQELETLTKSWQAANELTPDGIVGPISWCLGLKLEVTRGIDVSTYQGTITQATWDLLYETGIRFAYVRGVVGMGELDNRFAENVRRARAAGILATAYVFPYPLPKLDPKTQCELAVATLERALAGESRGPDLPLVWDLEWPPPFEKDKTGQTVDAWARWGCSASQIRDWSCAYLERSQELTAHRWALYTYRYFWRSIQGWLAPSLMDRLLVLANYTYKGRVPAPYEAYGTASLQSSVLSLQHKNQNESAGWEPTIIQHDGDGGLRLPNGADADFNVFLGNMQDLKVLRRDSDASQDEPPSTPKTLEDVLALVTASQHDIREAILSDGINEYRRSRLDEAEAA